MKKNLFKNAEKMKKALKISATALVSALVMSAGGCALAMMNDGGNEPMEDGIVIVEAHSSSEQGVIVSDDRTTESLNGESEAPSTAAQGHDGSQQALDVFLDMDYDEDLDDFKDNLEV